MKRVTLQFLSFEDLTEYSEVINIDKCNTNKRKLLIQGELSDGDIELAVTEYGASVLQEMQPD
jgi:hypothetical protein